MRSPLLRPRDADAVRAALRQMATITELPLTFGGEVHSGTLLLTEFFGTRTSAMRGLAVRPSAGLGGATVVARRPISVPDYRRSSNITHDYDGPVLSEGIRSILAVPVVVEGKARAVLYGAYRTSAPIGDRTAAAMVDSARRLSEELRIRDEVDRRMRMREAQLAQFGADVASAEQIREVHADLRRMAARASRPLATQLGELADRLARALSGDAPAATPLTAREIDVLSQIALGCTNAEAAQRLSLKPETVKSYLRSASSKLGAHSRHEAVSKARRLRQIP
ncbi:LuxR C-terminal-related transcriptional regulator [Mycolicibacterium smegmatis]|uniref:LuxR C-terminal-related transcriptional regulator n=1 Tax=Mycolicibacterium smegmatis TaxID=1772 RepID=UPI0005D7B420|nr:LuxR C-terminal-related transcriptional regulator [Mycolicibacterium smegmatis]MCP2621920.1 LuxR C-terminal-related transcriptional regulator [Mycolicibacterium smegmatis]MDF1901174.1 LuxR C-terminal-related transcriptional regulator [Mycolicibacterium smegmatis]MDF1907320.1 LuxR C-terminal-related transcriptional regulator [Mycolicibacterium smegmatis]MDF1919859.1 LuxR C-terminal-related transcriptional regulator [Mycolicibacterium smegmatis]MDF1925708.1 LuxR C-terminal-related transcripti